MLTVLLCAFIAYLIVHFTTKKGSFERGTAKFLFSIIGAFVGFFVAGIIGATLPQKTVLSHSVELAAMRSDTGGEATFFLFGSHSTVGWEYRFYFRNGELLSPRSLTVDQFVYILESSDVTPELRVTKTEFTETWHYWFGLMIPEPTYTFVVPKGSVVQEFKL